MFRNRSQVMRALCAPRSRSTRGRLLPERRLGRNSQFRPHWSPRERCGRWKWHSGFSFLYDPLTLFSDRILCRLADVNQTKTQYDCIIIGAGHNGLVCANYLARAGWKVLVLERRSLIGGACVTEPLWPGYKVSTASYVVSLLLPEIVRDLELDRHGYRVLKRSPSSFTPLEDGRYLLLGSDREFNSQQIAKFSARGAGGDSAYESA